MERIKLNMFGKPSLLNVQLKRIKDKYIYGRHYIRRGGVEFSPTPWRCEMIKMNLNRMVFFYLCPMPYFIRQFLIFVFLLIFFLFFFDFLDCRNYLSFAIIVI